MKNICGFIENHDTTNQWENEDLQDNADLFEQGKFNFHLFGYKKSDAEIEGLVFSMRKEQDTGYFLMRKALPWIKKHDKDVVEDGRVV